MEASTQSLDLGGIPAKVCAVINVVKLAEAARILGISSRAAESALRHAGIKSGYPLADVHWLRTNRPGQGTRTDLRARPTVVIRGYDGGTPTHRLTEALTAIDPDLMITHDQHRAVLLVIPRSTDFHAQPQRRASAEAAYDLHWAHETVVLDEDAWLEDDTHPLAVRLLPFAHLGTLPSAPRIPDEQRIAELPEPTLDGLTDDEIQMIGGRDRALDHVRAHQITNIRQDCTVDAYDWDCLARIASDTVSALSAPPKLTPGQRAQAAAAAVITAENRLSAARQSLAAHLRNATQAGEPVNLPDDQWLRHGPAGQLAVVATP